MKTGYRNSNYELDLSKEQPEPPLKAHGNPNGKNHIYSGVFEKDGKWHARISDPYSLKFYDSMDLGTYATKREAIAAYWLAENLYSQMVGFKEDLDGNSLPVIEYDSREWDDLGDGCFIRTQKPSHE